MNKLVIYLDSTCDMTTELLERFDLKYLKMGFTINDKEYEAALDWGIIAPDAFYAEMRKGTRVYTNAIKEVTFTEVFTKELDAGNDVLYIGCSSGLSASVTIAKKIAADLAPSYPSQRIRVVDPLTSGMAQGMMGIRASELRAAGTDLDVIVEELEREKLRYNQWATVGSLTYLARNGRVKASKAFFGNLFGVKPIIISDAKGHNFAYKKVKGRPTSIQEIIDSAKRTVIDPENHYLAVSHADCPEEAKKVKETLEKEIPCKEVFLTPLGPILGASCGPDTIIIADYGQDVTIVGED